MLIDAALIALWVAALVFAGWFTWTSPERDARNKHRRLMRELRRHNTDQQQKGVT